MSIETSGFVRRDAGLVNTDVSAFHSAKARIEQTKRLKSMDLRICELELAVESLQQICKERKL
jgi:hypothetical protein